MSTRLLVLLALALCVSPAVASAEVSPYRANDYGGGGFRDILPAGENGLVNGQQLLAYEGDNSKHPAHSTDQYAMYQNLLYGYPGLTSADIPKYYKDSSFGVKPDDVESTISPRSDVTIVRDKGFGVPHIYGSTRAGTMFGAGYATAQDKLFFMDVLRHAGRSDLASFAGGSNAGMDASTLPAAPYTDADLQAQIDQIPRLYGAEGQQVYDDASNFVAGINEYIHEAQLDPTKMPGEYAAIGQAQGPAPWQLTDLVAEASLVGSIFGGGGGGQLGQAQRLEAFQQKFGNAQGTTLWQDFLERNDPEAPTTELGRSFPLDQPPAHLAPDSSALPDAGSVISANDNAGSGGTTLPGGITIPNVGRSVPRTNVPPPTGTGMAARAAHTLAGLRQGLLKFPNSDSNALLIAGRHTVSGHPVAVIGPQVGYFNPQILMEEDLHGPGIDARGAAFDGLNLYVELGRGQDYAWSATSAGQDITHVFAVPLCNADGSTPTRASTSYVFRGACTPMSTVTKTESWAPNPADNSPPGSQTLTVQRTKLGPVIATALIAGKPVAYTQLRSTYFHEIDSALGFKEFNDPGVVHDAQSFQHAAYKIGYTFNWLYTDNRDIAYLNSGNNPAYDPRVDPLLPTAAKYEWQNFNPDNNTASYTPFAAHPQAINQDYLVSWNNKPAPGYGAGDTPIYRSQVLEDRVKALIANGHRATLPQLISAMEDGGTVDVRADKDLPLVLQVIGTPADPQLASAVATLKAWVADGSHRIDRTQSGTYAHSDAIAILDAWWPMLVKGEFEPTLGPDLYSSVFGSGGGDDPPNQHVGSAYNSDSYGFTHKDLRSVLGLPVRGAFSRIYCGGGTLSGCRAILQSTLTQALAAAANRQALYPAGGGCGAGDQACQDKIDFRAVGAVSLPLMPWVNRPTYQQALEILGHRPRSGTPSRTKTRCQSHRVIVVHLDLRRGVRLHSVVVIVPGHRRLTLRGARRSVRVSLVGLPAGTVRVRLRLRTSRGALTITRKLHTCRPGRHRKHSHHRRGAAHKH